ncbi:hypothetical protein GMORB2_3127 [Geosmithia morbida]|uniref:Wax synthase domain-containing protein n=1 Tax=Geosmithia morbida TaxID=1094350 RepID=A0A9P4YRK3_9HYPO|nr:uncharacterized protein GMORB2_3127 [Geosmithia morbida]KAF4120326.1 hypothetical protein GMORB2_3127 [Geosmithia morbida]
METGVTLAALITSYFIIFTTTVVLAPRSATAQRLVVAAAMIGLNYLFCQTLDTVVLLPSPRVNVVTLSWIACASGTEAVFVSRIDASQLILDGKGGGTGRGVGGWTLAWRALCVFFNLRRVGTRWEPANVRPPPGSARLRGRLRFVMAMTARCVACYLLVDLMSLLPRPEERLFTREKQTLWRLWDLSTEDVVFRLSACCGLWITSYLFQMFNVSLAGLLAVVAGLSRPELWPPVFGPLWTMYSIRDFWGTFWHQSLRKAITGWADYISDDVMRLTRGTLVSRYTRLLLAFFISGTLHLGQDRIYVTPGERYSSPTFFCVQALAIMVEDGLRALTAPLPIPQPVRRVVGYAWTVAWLWWITPIWMYPILRKGDVGSNVPFSLVHWALD